MVANDHKFKSITELWLGGDHYKWRQMRSNGVEEKYITGDASKKEKFLKWAETIPYTVGNPLYIWTHLELRKYFGIYENFSPKNASSIYDSMNETLKTLTARKIIENSNVDTICTTDDPIDDLRYHKLLKEDKSFDVHVYPSFRPDKVINIDWSSYVPYIKQLSQVVGYQIDGIKSLEKALKERIEYFHINNCRVSDHALDVVMYENSTEEEIDLIRYNKVNVIVTPYDTFKTSRLITLANPIKTIKRSSSAVCFGPNDYLTDFVEISNKLKHTNYPIVNSKGYCDGMLRLIDTNLITRKKVILVDHNEPSQSVDGLNEADILEIVDHHNIGEISTMLPINFRNMTVGSTNTIIYSLYKE